MKLAGREREAAPVRRREGAGLMGATLWVFDELPSTNDWLSDRGERCAHGETVRALRQTSGRGRGGRSWMHSEGGLTFSAALRISGCAAPPWHQGAAAALALAESLEGYGLVPRLKWPNDVWLDGRKVAGILSECRSDAPDVIVVGIGCNVNTPAAAFAAAGLTAKAVSMAMAAGRRFDPETVFADILRAWAARLEDIDRNGVCEIRTGWRRRDALAGRRVAIDAGGSLLEGVALGLDEDMALRLRDGKGREHAVNAGEAVHLGDLSR